MRKKAFTLIELLVVISIIAMLMAILMPTLARARQQGKNMICLSNLRQMAIAANTYLNDNDGYYPLAQLAEMVDGKYYVREWDFVRTFESGIFESCEPGILWGGDTILKIQQCPSFKGGANSAGDPYTGYNYNSSYIGGILQRDSSGNLRGSNSSRAVEVRKPSQCAIFGDGQYGDGANKFMRAPFTGKLDESSASLRAYGTQGFRHNNKTDVAYCDGSVSTVKHRFTETYPPLMRFVADGTGFLSADNSAYDLE
ncbi:MAG: type II secretion system protein [Planctomycetes bacterium]|nr:type II secretion system protein [Planctomycetota bacterium]